MNLRETIEAHTTTVRLLIHRELARAHNANMGDSLSSSGAAELQEAIEARENLRQAIEAHKAASRRSPEVAARIRVHIRRECLRAQRSGNMHMDDWESSSVMETFSWRSRGTLQRFSWRSTSLAEPQTVVQGRQQEAGPRLGSESMTEELESEDRSVLACFPKQGIECKLCMETTSRDCLSLRTCVTDSPTVAGNVFACMREHPICSECAEKLRTQLRNRCPFCRQNNVFRKPRVLVMPVESGNRRGWLWWRAKNRKLK